MRGEKLRFGVTMRELWREYKSEVVFFAVIVVIMVLGHRLSHFLSVEFFEKLIAPFQATALFTVCLVGAWMMFRHTEGSRVRLAWALTLLVWGVTEALLIALSAIWHLPTLLSGTDPLSPVSIVAGNILGWTLILYPTEALRPGWMNFRRALTQVLPLIALLVVDYFIPWNLASLLTLYPVVLVVLLITHVHAYRKWCEENYSSLDDIDSQWIVRYLAMLAAVGLSFFYLCMSDNPNRLFMQNILLFVMFVYSTEKILLRKDPWEGVVVNEEGELPIEEKPETVDTSANAAYRAKLEQWMQEKKPYLNPNFRLIDIREVLPLNRTYLSQLIHSEYDSTFYQFVNRYRIEEAKRLLHENPDMRIEDVASCSGFSSREVFTRVFTKETGVTPREWSKKV